MNKPGLTALRDYLATGQAVAFLGAGVSVPLYPLWNGLIGELVDAAAGRLEGTQAPRRHRDQAPLDETMYANRVLFSEELFEAYRHFMRTLFTMWTSTDADAPLRAPVESQWGEPRNMPWWDDSMTALFSTTDPSRTDDIQDAYEQLSEQFRAELYVTRQNQPLFTTGS